MTFDAGFPTVTACEGNVKFLIPDLKAFTSPRSDFAPSKAPVFYNPVMEFNRDLSVLALQVFQKSVNRGLKVCDLLTGCGIRGIRYATEVTGVDRVDMVDISKAAASLATHNVQMNGLAERGFVKHEHANRFLAEHSAPYSRFDVIDVDPFGAPIPYLDSAIRALRSDGLLAATATDMAPLCGVHPNACIRKYSGKPLRTEYCHELAVRLLVGAIAKNAAKCDMGLEILFSHYADHYVRVYTQMKHGSKDADETLTKMGYILHCFKCLHRENLHEQLYANCSNICSECGSKLSVAGPLWLGRIIKKQFVEAMKFEADRRLFKLNRRIDLILSSGVLEADGSSTYYDIDHLCDLLNVPVPSINDVTTILKQNGFEATRTLFSAAGIKSDALAREMKDAVLKLSTKAIGHWQG
jgi:tRNA (guanine26-N2/guanine27-N2)-dimethyltransferase